MFDWQKFAFNPFPTPSHSYCVKQRNNAVGASHFVTPCPYSERGGDRRNQWLFEENKEAPNTSQLFSFLNFELNGG